MSFKHKPLLSDLWSTAAIATDFDPESAFSDETSAKVQQVSSDTVQVGPSRFRTLELNNDAYAGQVVRRDALHADAEEMFEEIQESDNESSFVRKSKHSISTANATSYQQLMNRQLDEAQKRQHSATALTATTATATATAMQLMSKETGLQSHQVQKAKAVAKQVKLFDKTASLRIHLQRPFQAAQKLPRPAAHRELIADGSKLQRLMGEVAQESFAVADSILALQAKLAVRSPNREYPAAWLARKQERIAGKTPSTLAESHLCAELEADWRDFLPHTNKTMDIWDRKMRLVGSYENRKHCQPVLERAAAVAGNPHRVLHKMQAVAKNFALFGDARDAPLTASAEKYKSEPEMFNDSSFYRRLLKEIIDIGDTQESNFQQMELHQKMDEIEKQKQAQKMAFHQAKLRMKYTIRPDLENFMAPRFTHDPDFKVQQLFLNLLE